MRGTRATAVALPPVDADSAPAALGAHRPGAAVRAHRGTDAVAARAAPPTVVALPSLALGATPAGLRVLANVLVADHRPSRPTRRTAGIGTAADRAGIASRSVGSAAGEHRARSMPSRGTACTLLSRVRGRSGRGLRNQGTRSDCVRERRWIHRRSPCIAHSDDRAGTTRGGKVHTPTGATYESKLLGAFRLASMAARWRALTEK